VGFDAPVDLATGASNAYRSAVLHHAHNRLSAFARVALGFVLAAGACSSLRHGNAPDDEADAVTLTVVNHHQLNVTVFNVAGGRRDRLGEVTAAARASFTIHVRRLPSGELRLLADPVGSRTTATSELLRVNAGDIVQWVLETDLARSHIEIR